MAVVYLATQVRLGRTAALKEVDLRAGADLTRRFVREARLAGSLNHPGVVTVYDFFDHDNVPYIAMEFLPHGSLRPWIGRTSTAQAFGVLETTLAALGHAHARGIVHRDVKPENILIGSTGAVKLADFGIARAYANASARLTATGTTVGTPTYMAPEQAMNTDIGAWTDLYSLGVVAYELLLGRPPFAASDRPVDVLLQHVNDPLPPPRELDPELDAAVAAWLERMLAKAAAERPASAQAAWEELENAAVRVLGALWRRDARLLEPSLVEPPAVQPLLAQAAPAEPPPADEPATDQFITFEHRPPSRPPTPGSTEPRALHSILPPPDDPAPGTLQLAPGDALTTPVRAVAPPREPSYSLYSRGSRRRAVAVVAVVLLVV